ncbi:hypothetical protein C8J57DRAFT_1490012 [Mycena rebaudengoi]|nr:hypothetical protein C8J57DRAFT_1490012 [Mycena rebaudengoi]
MSYLPQEIIDAIVDHATADEGELRGGNEPREADTLKGCALTCACISLEEPAAFVCFDLLRHVELRQARDTCFGIPASYLCRLVIASYVKYFIIVLHADKYTRLVDFTVVSQILALLKNLVYLEVHLSLDGLAAHIWPTIFKNAFFEPLLLPAFQSLSLLSCTFADVLELESLLSHASGLNALTLKDVKFDHTDARRAEPVSHEPRIILSSLEVTMGRMHGAVDAMLSSFTMLDIKHLRSLDVSMWTPMIPFLKANAQTVQKVHCFLPERASICPIFRVFQTLMDGWGEVERRDPHILENNTSLRHIDITQWNVDMANSLRVFGDLGHLMALRTVSLRFQDQFGSFDDEMTKESWADLDKVLARARDTQEAVEIYVPIYKRWHIPVPDLAPLRSWLPSVARKISLHKIKEEEDND